MYLFCLFMRVLLSWFPEIDWNAQPWTFLRLVRRAQGSLRACIAEEHSPGSRGWCRTVFWQLSLMLSVILRAVVLLKHTKSAVPTIKCM